MKVGCGAIDTVIKRSPGALAPAAPWPRNRTLLAIGDPGGDLDLDVLAVRQPHALRGALRRVKQRHGQRRRDIGSGAAAKILGFETRTAPSARTRAGESVAENILEAAETTATATGTSAGTPAPRPAGEAFGTEGECFEFGVGANAAGTEAATRAPAGIAAKALKATEARFALGVDFAAVEGLTLVVFT